MKNGKTLILLSLITLLGFLLRFANVSRNPYGLFCDEASIGYNAYSLLTTGKDDSGANWPLFFKSFGEYKNPIQIYSTIPFVFLFGLNEFSTRLPSVFYGTLSIIAIYFLARPLFEKNIALISALLLSISPWHIHLSRMSPEGLTPLVFLLILGTLFFIKSRENPNYLLISSTFFALSVYAYFAARIFTPLFVIGLFILLFKNSKKYGEVKLASFILFAILLLPIFIHTISGPGLARWKQVSNLEGKSKTQVLKQVSVNYFNYFSYNFLFAKGDANFPGQFIKRYSVSGIGQLYLFQLPLIIIGLLSLVKKGGDGSKILSLWLLLYPLPGSITQDLTPYATRGITGIIPFQIISGVGLINIFQYFKKLKKVTTYILSAGIGIIFLLYFSRFLSLLEKYPLNSSDYWGWQAGPREVMDYFLKSKDLYDEMYIEGKFNAPEIFIKFYDPENSCENKCKIGEFNKFNPDKIQLFALTPESLNNIPRIYSFKQKSVVKYPSGEVAFYIGEFNYGYP